MEPVSLQILAPGVHADGFHESPGIYIPPGAQSVKFVMDRSAWQDQAIKVSFSFHLMFDGSVEWVYAGGFEASGGDVYTQQLVLDANGVVVLDGQGQPTSTVGPLITESAGEFSLPQPQDGMMQIKCSGTLAGGPASSSAVLIFQ